MFRKEARKELLRLAEEHTELPARVMVSDSYEDRLIICITQTGDIAVSTTRRGATFAGIGGGDDRPLTKEALRLLALAMQAEQ
jgi:hypothetical protein